MIEYKNYAVFYLSKFEDHRDLIIPLFFIYTLKTRKYLDFNDWAEAINIKSNSTPSKRKDDNISLFLRALLESLGCHDEGGQLDLPKIPNHNPQP